MNVGRSAPRHEKIGLLYPRSKDLQSFLFEYFIVVVHLCHQMLKFTRKSALGKLGTALSDSELSDFQSQLNFWADAIEKEMVYLMAQRIEEQADLSVQRWPAKFSKKASHRRQESAYFQALKFCSDFDRILPWKQARKAGGTFLFHQSPEYMDWRDSSTSRSLVLTGKLGSGKSVLLANMVDDLNIHVQDKKIPVAFFFCRHDLPESLKPRTIIGSLIGQLLRPTSELADSVENSNLITNVNPFGTMRDLLQLCFPMYSKAYFVIDGLDECDTADRNSLLIELRQLQDMFTICVCATVRQQPTSPFVDDTRWTLLAQAMVTAIPDNRQDIEAFIEGELESRISNGKLVTGDPLLVLDIQDALVNGSQGMFLWVALQIETLCSMTTDEAIRQALADLPRDLSETFARILSRCGHLSPDKSHQKTILELITVARRPLTAEELREALSVIPGDPTWNPSRLLNNIYGILACCGSLLILDEEEMTVRLVHKSVEQFLIESKASGYLDFTVDAAQRTMRDIIVTYLNYGVFESQVSTKVTPKVQIDSAPTAIVRSTLEHSGGVRDVALRLLKSRKKPGFDIGKTLAECGARRSPDRPQDFHFLQYARSNCLFHVLQSPDTEKQQTALLLRLLGGATSDSVSDDDWNQLFFHATEAGNEEIVKFVLHSGRVNPNTENSDGCTVLHQAVVYRQEGIVTLLLDSLDTDPMLQDVKGQTESSKVVFRRRFTMPGQLGVNPNATNDSGQAPLHVAAENAGSENIAKLLLRSPFVHPHQNDLNGATPLLLAVQRGNTGVAKAMIQSGKVDVNHGTGLVIDIFKSRTPLHEAAKKSNVTIANLLLDTKNIKCICLDEAKRTPLHEAISEWAEDIAIRLITHDSSGLHMRDDKGMTALHLAAFRGTVKVVNRILECDQARLHDKDNMGRMPLDLAREQRQYAAVDALLSWEKLSPGVREDLKNISESRSDIMPRGHFQIGDVDLNARDQDERTLLQRLIASGAQPETLRVLTEISDVNPECRDRNQQTALHIAAIFDTGPDISPDSGLASMHWGRIEALLNSGKFDNVLDAKDANGFTPLGIAEMYANEQGIRALRTSDAVLMANKRLHDRLIVRST